MEPSAFSLPPKSQFLPPIKRALIGYCIADSKALHLHVGKIHTNISQQQKSVQKSRKAEADMRFSGVLP
jgi:hypothetical protein